MMRSTCFSILMTTAILLIGCTEPQASAVQEDEPLVQYVDTDSGRWMVHDMNRPAPPVVNPGEPCFTAPPADAIVLFDGTDLSQWISASNGTAARWLVQDGFMEARPQGDIRTRQEFGSCQLHLEFATPARVRGSGQGRGNSGVFLQGHYEVQVLDSCGNKTYPDGQCAALYGRAVPLVNACRAPGQWQSYDIIYHRPVFDGDRVVRKATFTVIQNGILVQDHVELDGGTGWQGPHRVTRYEPHGDTGPLLLQDHGNPVRYRNIWLRPLKD